MTAIPHKTLAISGVCTLPNVGIVFILFIRSATKDAPIAGGKNWPITHDTPKSRSARDVKGEIRGAETVSALLASDRNALYCMSADG
jgi:hypothetical protein